MFYCVAYCVLFEMRQENKYTIFESYINCLDPPWKISMLIIWLADCNWHSTIAV